MQVEAIFRAVDKLSKKENVSVSPEIMIPLVMNANELRQMKDILITKIKEIESDLTVGRVLVRPSGTENKIRVMVESDDEPTAKKYAEDIAKMFIS